MRPICLVLIAAAIAFGFGLAGPFHLDDFALLSDPAITSPSGWWQVWTPLQTRPLTYFTFWLNYQAGGANPVGYHVVNLLLHLASVWLLYGVLQRMLPEKAALIAAAIFALHPIQSEPANYIFARGTLLATLFCLLCWRAFLDKRFWLAVGWFALALLSKEECVTFPLFLLLVHLWGGRPRPRRASRPVYLQIRLRDVDVPRGSGDPPHKVLAGMLGLSLAAGLRVLWASTVIQGSGAGAQAGIRPLEYFGAQALVLLRYARLLLVPYGFSIDPEIAVVGGWRAWLGWAMIVSLIALAWWKTRNGWWLAGAFILLAPSSTILPAADLAADRRLYLPMLAIAPWAGLQLHRANMRILAAVAVVLAGLSFERSRVWANPQALWTEAMESAPHKVRPRIQLARVSDAQTALKLLDEAEHIAPRDPAPSSEKGMRLLQLGRPDLALAAFGRTLSLSPRDPQAINNRGVALMMLDQREAALADFRRALEIDPNLADARANLQRLATSSAK